MNDTAVFAPMTWSDIAYLAPELVIAAVFILLVVIDLFIPKQSGKQIIGWLTIAGIIASLVLTVLQMLNMGEAGVAGQTQLLGNSYRVDHFASLLKIIFLAGTALIALLGLDTARKDDEIAARGEYFYLLLPAVMGAMMMASSGNFVTLYIGLELLSLTSYVLVGMKRKSSLSAEAAFKYLVTGSIASAFILFGMSYLYGVTGSVDLEVINQVLPAAFESFSALIYVGFAFMLAGFGIKIAAAPFHAWAPDVYQGAPTPVTAFLAVIAKGAALAAVFRIMFNTVLIGSGEENAIFRDDIFLITLWVAAAAMIIGTTTALRQKNAKRLLAYSGIANAGYMLVPIGISITSVHSSNFAEFLYYLAAYLLMTVGAFAVLAVVSRAAGHDELKGFSGMYYRAPWTAVAMVIFILSLAGLPLTGGFFGKLFILLGAASAKAYWLAAIMVVSSVISYYFYFLIARQMFMRSGDEHASIQVGGEVGTVIWLCAALTVVLGLLPGPIMSWIESVFSVFYDLMLIM